MKPSEPMPPSLLKADLDVQLSRVRRLGFEAIAAPGSRITGLALLVFARVFAEWFVAGVSSRSRKKGVETSPFTYTMR